MAVHWQHPFSALAGNRPLNATSGAFDGATTANSRFSFHIQQLQNNLQFHFEPFYSIYQFAVQFAVSMFVLSTPRRFPSSPHAATFSTDSNFY